MEEKIKQIVDAGYSIAITPLYSSTAESNAHIKCTNPVSKGYKTIAYSFNTTNCDEVFSKILDDIKR